MVSKAYSVSNIGMDNYLIEIECDSNRSLPTIDIVGLPDASVKEAKERIKATFRNCGLEIPSRKFVVNLSPSDIRKTGNRFDLPIAAALLASVIKGVDNKILKKAIFVGELGLDGDVKRVEGVLSAIIEGKKQGFEYFFVPEENVYEGSFLDGVKIVGVDKFETLVDYLTGKQKMKVASRQKVDKNVMTAYDIDFADIRGNSLQKRALMIAAAGLHNVLMIGSPGSGKTMLAKAVQGILPPMNWEEIFEVSQIYSVNGLLNEDQPLIFKRPFRAVHHTASQVSIVGGGTRLTPGEISLAHKGILFFDELPEFPRAVLEVLRQPLEDRKIIISRVVGSAMYPAHFMFLSALNPCKCGYYKDLEKACTCSHNEIKRYQNRISGPLLDRFDAIIEVPRIKIDNLMDTSRQEKSEHYRKIVTKAWAKQKLRFKNEKIFSNSEMSPKHIQKYCQMSPEAEQFLKTAAKNLALTARSVHRIIKFSRTVADINSDDQITQKNIAETLQYRTKNLFIGEDNI